MKKNIILVLVVAAVIAVALGWYFMVEVVESGVRAEIMPNPIRLDDQVTWTILVTNGEATAMTITGLIFTIYKDDQFLSTFRENADAPYFVTTTVPPRRTVVVYRRTDPGPTQPEEIGEYRIEVICHTNFENLKTALEVRVVP